MADIEDMYELTYIPGLCITVDMDDKDLVLERRDKIYVTDFSEWIVSDECRVEELYKGPSLMTVIHIDKYARL
jgi:hypothetical protein